jgi:hypothetical protein
VNIKFDKKKSNCCGIYLSIMVRTKIDILTFEFSIHYFHFRMFCGYATVHLCIVVNPAFCEPFTCLQVCDVCMVGEQGGHISEPS